MRIHMLVGLRDHGVITAQEFEVKKAELLSNVVSEVCGGSALRAAPRHP
jgi:Short C-terminal domain